MTFSHKNLFNIDVTESALSAYLLAFEVISYITYSFIKIRQMGVTVDTNIHRRFEKNLWGAKSLSFRLSFLYFFIFGSKNILKSLWDILKKA